MAESATPVLEAITFVAPSGGILLVFRGGVVKRLSDDRPSALVISKTLKPRTAKRPKKKARHR